MGAHTLGSPVVACGDTSCNPIRRLRARFIPHLCGFGLISADLASSLRIRELVVLLVNEDEGNQNSQIKPESGLLAVPTGRLPHLKPFTTDNHKTEEPYQEAAGSADEDEPFGAVEAVCAGAQLPQQSDRRARQRQAG